MLERAILDYVGNDRKELEAAKEWIFDEQQEHLAKDFTFVWVCDQLDLDPNFIRSTVERMPRRGAHRVAPWYFDREYLQQPNKLPHAGKSKNNMTFLKTRPKENICKHSVRSC